MIRYGNTLEWQCPFRIEAKICKPCIGKRGHGQSGLSLDGAGVGRASSSKVAFFVVVELASAICLSEGIVRADSEDGRRRLAGGWGTVL